jgi:predicted transposase YbfD/YdcC
MNNIENAPQNPENPDTQPESEPTIIQSFNLVKDPRKPAFNFRHPLTSILFTTVVCSLCGSDDWETIVIQANAMKGWLGQFVDMSNGVPCVRTFTRVFSLLKPEELNRVLCVVAGSLGVKTEGEVISFDGKTMKGTSTQEKGLKAIHMLNAWSHERGICLGHMKVDDKSNEIPAVPQLMELLDLKGTIITADAMNTQKKTAAKAIELGADYVLPLKGNQAGLLEEVELLFSDAQKKKFRGVDADNFETMEKGHGRVEVRKYFSIDASELLSTKDWAGLNSAGMVVRERTFKGKTSCETQYYISSCEIDAKLLGKVTRGHWGIENSLHWVLDVTFREDKLRYRDRIGAQNLATIRKLTLAALARDKTLKCGKAGKRIAAATDPKYRESVLKLLF